MKLKIGAKHKKEGFVTLEKLANAFPLLFERLWCYWIGGAESVYFKLKVVKNEYK
jgi:hypothetical protein